MDIQQIIIIISIASIAGFLSGLLGIGGGILTVPIIVYMLKHNFGPLEFMQQIAIGTSFTVMLFTILSSSYAHHKNGNVVWSIVKKIVLPIILGTALGALLSPYIPSDYLQIVFILFIFTMAIKTLINLENKTPVIRELTNVKLKSVGFLTGLLSSWIGIGGGSIFVPFLLRYNIDIKKCLGTSAALGFPIALIGFGMYLITGLKYSSQLPPHSIGFVYWPYALGLAVCTMIFSPFGAKVSAKSNPKLLKVLFVILLLTIGIKMALDIAPKLIYS